MRKVATLFLVCSLCSMLVACSGSDGHIGEAKTPSGSSKMKGRDYESVVESFEEKGFTNIRLETIDDLVLGWLTKEGEVEKVTVGGDEKYSSDKWLPADIEVVIYYHAFPPKTYDVGDTITFGVRYNVIGDLVPLKWEVVALDEENNKILIRTQQIIDGQPFGLNEEETSWEDSYLRSWLNNEFYYNQFTESERLAIAETVFTYGDKDVTDKVFIPSYEEAASIDNDRYYRAKATEYAFRQGVTVYNSYHIDHPVRTQRNTYRYDSDDSYTSRYSNENSYCSWWLRPAYGKRITIIDGWGDYEAVAPNSYDSIYGVRPALWLDLSVDY